MHLLMIAGVGLWIHGEEHLPLARGLHSKTGTEVHQEAEISLLEEVVLFSVHWLNYPACVVRWSAVLRKKIFLFFATRQTTKHRRLFRYDFSSLSSVCLSICPGSLRFRLSFFILFYLSTLLFIDRYFYLFFCSVRKDVDTWTKEDLQTTDTVTQVHPGIAAQIATTGTTGSLSRTPVCGTDTPSTLPRLPQAFGTRGHGRRGIEEGVPLEVGTSRHKIVDHLTVQNMMEEGDQNHGNETRWNVEQRAGNTRTM